jgi:hypothetical protein
VDNSARQLDAAAGVELLELELELDVEPEPELSDPPEFDFSDELDFSDEVAFSDEPDDSAFVADPSEVLFAVSRLSLR